MHMITKSDVMRITSQQIVRASRKALAIIHVMLQQVHSGKNVELCHKGWDKQEDKILFSYRVTQPHNGVMIAEDELEFPLSLILEFAYIERSKQHQRKNYNVLPLTTYDQYLLASLKISTIQTKQKSPRH